LDILPALSGKSVTVGRIWSGANRAIVVRLVAETTDWTEVTRIRLDLISPDGAPHAALDFTESSNPDAVLQTISGMAGFYTLQLTTNDTPATNLNPTFKLSVSYQSDCRFELPKME
jgi:hypothetical protein